MFDGVSFAGTPPALAEDVPWSKLVLNASGGPGTWITIYQPFPEPRERVIVSYAFEAQTIVGKNQTVGFLSLPPALVHGTGGPLVPNLESLRLNVADGAIDISRESDQDWAALSGAFYGLFSAFGSNEAWSVWMEVSIDGDGGLTGPQEVWAGEGAEVTTSLEGSGGLNTGAAGLARVEMNLEVVGWTHLEVITNPIVGGDAHAAARQCRVSLGSNPVICTDVVLSHPLRAGRMYGAWGAAPNGPGTAWLEIAHAETTSRLSLAAIHLPLTETPWPTEFQNLSYVVSKPF